MKSTFISSLFTVVLCAASMGCAATTDAESEIDSKETSSELLPDEVRRFINLATSQCMDSNSAGSAYTLGCNGGNYQIWNIHPWRDNTYEIKNIATGRCLATHGGPNYDNDAYTAPCNKDDQLQSWYMNVYGNGTRRFSNQATGKCLDTHGGDLYTRPCNDGDNERWLWN
ncbi:RICIN domain-containing protein [Pendulispora brunnea]|uniref:RICIN domain-containing protein n=1 Tax=Pendulispora brunnea TaxID=2905690 RepID=A0ABZ2JV94_9BACT